MRKKTTLWMTLVALVLLSFQPLSAQKRSKEDKEKEKNLRNYQMVGASAEVQKRLLEAIKRNDTTQMVAFLNNGGSINFFSSRYDYQPSQIYDARLGNYTEPLLAAILSGSKECAEVLLSIEPRLVNSQCLHAAIDKNDTAMLIYLIEQGADINLNGNEQYKYFDDKITQLYKPVKWWSDHDVYGGKPIDFALAKERYEMLAILKRYGVSVSQATLNELLLKAASWGNRGDNKKCEALVSMGADVNTIKPSNPYGGIYTSYTPLLYAAKWNNVALAKFFIEHGADINWNNSFESVLFFAVYHPGQKDYVQYLLDKGANVNFVGRDGILAATPTLSILKVSKEEYKDMLIMKGAR